MKAKVNKNRPVKSSKKPIKAKAKKPSATQRQINKLEDKLAALAARLEFAEAAIQVLRDAAAPEDANFPWVPAPSPFPSWPNQPKIIWTSCIKEEYDTHKNNKNKSVIK